MIDLLSIVQVWPPFGMEDALVPDVLTYTFTGPSTATVGVPSDDFYLTLGPGFLPVLVRITPNDGVDNGTFFHAYVPLTDESRSGTFKYTPGSVGTKTICVTNNGGLIDPPCLTILVSEAPPPDDLKHGPIVELDPAATTWYRRRKGRPFG